MQRMFRHNTVASHEKIAKGVYDKPHNTWLRYYATSKPAHLATKKKQVTSMEGV
jgi:hypothetical protein